MFVSLKIRDPKFPHADDKRRGVSAAVEESDSESETEEEEDLEHGRCLLISQPSLHCNPVWDAIAE